MPITVSDTIVKPSLYDNTFAWLRTAWASSEAARADAPANPSDCASTASV